MNIKEDKRLNRHTPLYENTENQLITKEFAFDELSTLFFIIFIHMNPDDLYFHAQYKLHQKKTDL